MEALESVVRGPKGLLVFPHTRLYGEAIGTFVPEYAMVMERMEKATTSKIVPKTTAIEASRPMEIEEEIKLSFVTRVIAPPLASPEYYEWIVTPCNANENRSI